MASISDTMALDVDSYVVTQQLLLASAHHDIESLRTILKTVSANVQDADTGYTGLHAAIASCAQSDTQSDAEHLNDDLSTQKAELVEKLELAEQTLKLLLQNGAIWNDLDLNHETPGCLAYRLGLSSLYEIMVDAGVRAELLLNRLDAFAPLVGVDGSDEDEEDEDVIRDTQMQGRNETLAASGLNDPTVDSQTPSVLLDPKIHVDDSSTLNLNYLSSSLVFSKDRILDSSANGVMMTWESNIMQKTASLLLPRDGLRVLNIGFGMGIFDGFVQDEHQPAEHHIVEAHADVLDSMKEKGWDSEEAPSYKRRNVTIHSGMWQTILPRLVEQNITFDAIFFDTFAEGYNEFREFFNEYVIALLEPQGKWSFFHGLGADRQVCYDVYTKVSEMDLFEAGFEVDWEETKTPELEEENGDAQDEWKGVRRKYFNVEKYRLPICRFVG